VSSYLINTDSEQGRRTVVSDNIGVSKFIDTVGNMGRSVEAVVPRQARRSIAFRRVDLELWAVRYIGWIEDRPAWTRVVDIPTGR
jgi:hypothetical protein